MTTPTKSEILAKAEELFRIHRSRNGDPSYFLSPTPQELKEGGFIQSAISQLMSDMHRETIESDYIDYPQEFSVDLQELFESNALILGSRHTGKSDIAMMICDKAIEHDAIVVIFDPSTDWIARSRIPKYVKVEPYTILDVPSKSVIYDISLLSPNQHRQILEAFSKKLFVYQATSQNRKQYLVICEEAHTYFYQGCMRAKNYQNTVKMLSVGRNVDIACVLITQFASMLDKFCVKHAISQMWLGFSRESNDLKYLRQIIGEQATELVELGDGEFLYVTRTGISKVAIEPYNSSVPKQQILQVQPKPIVPIKPKQNIGTVIYVIAMIIMWLIAIITVLGQKVM